MACPLRHLGRPHHVGSVVTALDGGLRTYVAAATLPSACVWVRPTVTSGDLGETAETWTTVGASVPCRIARLQGREAADAARTNSAAEWVISLPYGTAIKTGDALDSGGKRYQVVGFSTSDTALLVRAWCQ